MESVVITMTAAAGNRAGAMPSRVAFYQGRAAMWRAFALSCLVEGDRETMVQAIVEAKRRLSNARGLRRAFCGR